MQKAQKRPAEVLTKDEVRRILDACSNRHSSGIRLQAMIGVMYGCGLRIAEMLALAPRDVDLEGRELLVRHGKGDKSRRLGMPAETVLLLERWARRRESVESMPANAPLFCTYSAGTEGRPIYPQQVRVALFRAARRAGIDKRVHPHGFRHSFAYEQAMAKVPIHVIKDALGHTSLAHTDTYISHLGPRDVVDRMQAWEW